MSMGLDQWEVVYYNHCTMNLEKTICLARHGTTEYNEKNLLQGRIDIPLSDLGIKESQRLGEALKDMKFDIMFHSPLIRARQTAEHVNRYHNLEMRVIEPFAEIDMGDWEGLDYFEMIENNPGFHNTWMKDPFVKIPGGESFSMVFERVKPGVEEILACDYKHIFIAGHAAVNRGILGALLGMNHESSRMFRMKNCAYSTFLVYENRNDRFTIVESWNNTSHLEGIK